jgi:uncharacterized protein (TIGR00369 family)
MGIKTVQRIKGNVLRLFPVCLPASAQIPCPECRTAFWTDKHFKGESIMNLTELNGLEILQKMIDGAIPPPSMAETIPMNLSKLEKGYVEFLAKAGRNHLNPLGTVHGGFAATVLDSVTGCAVHTMLGPGDSYGTVDLNIKMLKPVPLDTLLTAKGKIIHCSKRIGVSEGVLTDEEGNIYAHATATCMISRVKEKEC